MQAVGRITGIRLTSRRRHLRSAISFLGGLLSRLFICWHWRMSWPITRDNKTYRTCLKCGICREFDPQTWKSFGPFYRTRV